MSAAEKVYLKTRIAAVLSFVLGVVFAWSGPWVAGLPALSVCCFTVTAAAAFAAFSIYKYKNQHLTGLIAQE